VARSVSVVIVVHNESRHIVRKLHNLLSLEHSDGIREILVGSDGSTDNTPDLVRGFPDARVRLVAFAERRGKPAVLNDVIAQATGDIVLLADARQEFDRRCLVELVANFADERVGVVSGELVLRRETTRTTAAEGIGFYWVYEKFLRKAESRFRGVPGATGACYALRRAQYRPIPPATILDDVAIPLQIVAQGGRCVFEPLALAYDDPSSSPEQEAVRKRRTIAGAAQLVRLFPHWLWPGCQPLWFEFLSHKLLRLVSPVLLVTAVLSNLWLFRHGVYGGLLALQAVFYVSAAYGWWLQAVGRRSRLFGPVLMFLTLNGTTALALWDACRSRYRVTWTRAAT
jgi:cellulose synthase/poly-beta-1,6-N-acetylglucosamine synthase-like glycosyltransferase